MAVVDVRITSSHGQFIPSQETVPLSKEKGETIKWHNDTTEKIQINFSTGTPFPGNRNPYDIDPGHQVDSGSIQVAYDTKWSYEIRAASGAVADPQVIIQR